MNEKSAPQATDSPSKTQKFSIAKEKIAKYFTQLVNGCGDPECTNYCCASSENCAWPNVSRNQAAVHAVHLMEKHAELCTPYDPAYLTEAKLTSTFAQCQAEKDPTLLIKYFSGAASSVEVFSKSFTKQRRADSPAGVDSLDLDAARRTFGSVFALEEPSFHAAAIEVIISLSASMTEDLHSNCKPDLWLKAIRIILEVPCLHSPDYMEEAFPLFLRAASRLPLGHQAQLVVLLSKHTAEQLRHLLQRLQQLVTVKILRGEWSNEHLLNDDTGITCAVLMMRNVYYASILGGACDSRDILDAEAAYSAKIADQLRERTAGSLPAARRKKQPAEKESALEKMIGVRPIDSRVPLLEPQEFLNEMVNEKIEMDHDLFMHKSSDGYGFSFLSCPFVLSTATKSLAMFYDNRLRMIVERRSAFMHTLLRGAFAMPYLRLQVRRDHLIEDALNGLEMVYTEDPADLKKQLYVEFVGEQGIDEGGVSKEFFQLVVEELFNPDYGMFIYNEETCTYWFNHGSFENDAQFTLVGIVLGLAIYNGIILDIHLPKVVYRKLLGKLGTVEDLSDSHPVLHRSLKYLLAHQGNVQEDLMMTFCVSHLNVFGGTEVHALKENGEELPVTNGNREEFVSLYADHLLNKLVEVQFAAFARGFLMVTEESPLQQLFLPSEVELLVCGSRDWDFKALQDACDYDGGYTADTPIIRHFWDIVHKMSDSEKRLLLQFATGSDRVPVGGLARLRLVITRHGPDSSRLPTAHTCFNVLLLPEYSSFEKLQERLLLAITHAKGFGML